LSTREPTDKVDQPSRAWNYDPLLKPTKWAAGIELSKTRTPSVSEFGVAPSKNARMIDHECLPGLIELSHDSKQGLRNKSPFSDSDLTSEASIATTEQTVPFEEKDKLTKSGRWALFKKQARYDVESADAINALEIAQAQERKEQEREWVQRWVDSGKNQRPHTPPKRDLPAMNSWHSTHSGINIKSSQDKSNYSFTSSSPRGSGLDNPSSSPLPALHFSYSPRNSLFFRPQSLKRTREEQGQKDEEDDLVVETSLSIPHAKRRRIIPPVLSQIDVPGQDTLRHSTTDYPLLSSAPLGSLKRRREAESDGTDIFADCSAKRLRCSPTSEEFISLDIFAPVHSDDTNYSPSRIRPHVYSAWTSTQQECKRAEKEGPGSFSQESQWVFSQIGSQERDHCVSSQEVVKWPSLLEEKEWAQEITTEETQNTLEEDAEWVL